MNTEQRERDARKIINKIQKGVDKLKELNYKIDCSYNTIGFFDADNNELFVKINTGFNKVKYRC